MIEIKNKQDCCGCSACALKCPKKCITMKEDEEGFLYPFINTNLCINCGICQKVCPTINQNAPRKPLQVWAAKNNNPQIRVESSSGGIFTFLAEKTIENNGVVFGACFNENWDVIHSHTETKEGLKYFRGSKYVQSKIENSYKEAELFLKQGRDVLFSGTPCQIAGLKCFLKKDYKNLLTIDFVCHGVPSPQIWKQYLNETSYKIAKQKLSIINPILNKNYKIKNIAFRDKRLGWKKYSFILTISSIDSNETEYTLQESKYKNRYLHGFLRNLYLRPSCHACVTKDFKSGSDITIADFWGINDYMKNQNDHKGHSLIFIHNNEKITINNNIEIKEIEKESILKTNLSIKKSAQAHNNRTIFFEEYNKGTKNIVSLIAQYGTVSFKKKINLILASLLKN